VQLDFGRFVPLESGANDGLACVAIDANFHELLGDDLAAFADRQRDGINPRFLKDMRWIRVFAGCAVAEIPIQRLPTFTPKTSP
jgi:hypothetical protein